jgi:hypothetical protein
MPKGLELVHEDETGVYFAYPSFMFGAVALVGWVSTVLALFFVDGVRRWAYVTMMSLLGGVGTWGGFWREDVYLDIIHRRYCRRRGFWPGLKKLEGSFEEIPGIFLARETRQFRYRVYTVWAVRLALPGEKEGLTILSFDDENEASRRLEALSLKLHLRVTDSPGSRVQHEGHSELA